MDQGAYKLWSSLMTAKYTTLWMAQVAVMTVAAPTSAVVVVKAGSNHTQQVCAWSLTLSTKRVIS